MLPVVVLKLLIMGILDAFRGTREKIFEFICSKLFAGNMEWFNREVKNIDDISHLFWDNFL
jgi:hypothetical protein